MKLPIPTLESHDDDQGGYDYEQCIAIEEWNTTSKQGSSRMALNQIGSSLMVICIFISFNRIF